MEAVAQPISRSGRSKFRTERNDSEEEGWRNAADDDDHREH